MKHRLLDLLACPRCTGQPLGLTVLETEPSPAPKFSTTRCESYCGWEKEAITPGETRTRSCFPCYAQEVTEGLLHCPECGACYPVIGGIPRFNPDVQADYPEFFRRHATAPGQTEVSTGGEFGRLHGETKRSFGFQWLRYRVTDHAENQAHFYRRTAIQPGTLPGQLLFEAGCGMGRYLRVIADEPDAEVVGLDLSLAVNRAYTENRSCPFVHVVQGNILQLPLRRETFDHVYSIGVLHHTPSTREAFRQIARLAKPGGRVSIWVYHVWCPPNLKGVKALHARLRGWISDALRVVTTRLPHRLLHYFCYLAVPIGWMQIRIRRLPVLFRALFSPILLIPFSDHPDWRVRVLDTFDWLSPRYQWKHTVEEVAGWFQEEDLVELNTQGFEVSVRGRKPA